MKIRYSDIDFHLEDVRAIFRVQAIVPVQQPQDTIQFLQECFEYGYFFEPATLPLK
jgi:hypothetical protein